MAWTDTPGKEETDEDEWMELAQRTIWKDESYMKISRTRAPDGREFYLICKGKRGHKRPYKCCSIESEAYELVMQMFMDVKG